MAHQLFSIKKSFLYFSTFLVIYLGANYSFAQEHVTPTEHNNEVREYKADKKSDKAKSNRPMEKQRSKKNIKKAGKTNADVKLSEGARKSVSKDIKKFKPHVNATTTKQKQKQNRKNLGNAVEVVVEKEKGKKVGRDAAKQKGYVVVDKNKGKKMNKAAANHKGYVVVEKKPGRKVSREAANYKGGYVVVEKKPGRKVAREAYRYRGYVVVDRSRNRRIARKAANFEPNYIKIKQQLSLTKMYYGKGHGKNSFKYVQKKRFAPHFKEVYPNLTKGKTNAMKEKPLKYTYSKDEAEIWN